MRSPAFAIAGSFLIASLLCRLVLSHPPAAIATDLRQPVAVVTNWHAFGALLFVILFAACAVGTIAYIRTIRAVPSTRFAIGLCVVALACGWLMPVIFSSDVYAYAAYGELFRTGGNPYAHVLLPSGNPIFDAARWQWGNPPPTCVYGPAFVLLAGAIVSATHSLTVAVTLDALRIAASLAIPLCALLAYAAYSGDETERVAAATIIGLNPIAIWCAVEGHNDTLALAAVLGGFALARNSLAGAGGALAALSGALKFPGIVAAVPIALSYRGARAGAAIGALAAVLLSIPLLHGVATQLMPRGRYAPQASFEAIVKPLALLVFRDDGIASIATWSIALLAALGFVLTAIRMLRRGRRDGWAQLAAGGWLLVPNPYPWYALWLLPIAAISPRSKASVALLWLALASLLRYLPDAVAALTPVQEVILGIAATIPLAALFAKHDGNYRTA
jgi:hypothetical protein